MCLQERWNRFVDNPRIKEGMTKTAAPAENETFAAFSSLFVARVLVSFDACEVFHNAQELHVAFVQFFSSQPSLLFLSFEHPNPQGIRRF